MAGDGGAASLEVSLLGGFRIAAGDVAIEDRAWRLRKAAAVVKLLCLSPGHRLQRDQLLEVLWPDLAPEAAANNLHYTLHVARRTLEAAFPAAGQWLHARGGVVELRPAVPVVVDVAVFEAAATEAEASSDPADCAAALQRYAGDLLPDDAYEEWTVGRREYLRDRYQALLRKKARLHEQRGEHAAAVQTLTQALSSEPASEEVHSALMRLYALAGQRDRSLRQFQQLREALRRELDAEPDPATQRLYEKILSGRVGTASPQPDAGWGLWGQSTLAARKHNIPYALTTFVGRRRELAELPALLAEHRLVTLAGTGGCGKTRLALEVAHALVDTVADGVWLVELAPLADGRLIPQAAAAAMGVVEEAARPLLETLCRQLDGRELVLVLDNCEHVLAEAAAFADAVLRAAPAVRVLATSREPLGIVGEVVRRVASLGLPTSDVGLLRGALEEDGDDTDDVDVVDGAEESEAVGLFVDRARRVQPAFRLDARNARAVAQICLRLDGIPLAIELAAARADAVSLPEIADRLDDCFRLLTNGGRTAAARHQTLRAAVDWSYVLLTEGERRLFNQLSVFGGAFGLDAAERICGETERGGGDDVLTLLAQLVSKSLVVAANDGTDGRLRYRLLEPLRQYAAERLRETGDDDERQRRHAAYFTTLAEEAEEALTGVDQLAWLERLEAEHDNLRAALRWSLAARDATDAEDAGAGRDSEGAAGAKDTALGVRMAAALARFWLVRSRLEEGQRWLETAVERSAALDELLRAKVLAEAGSMAAARGDYARAADLHEESLRLRRDAGEARGIGWSLISLGDVAYARGDYAAARPLYEEALDHLRDAADQRGIATAYGNLGYVARTLGNYGYAEMLCRQSLRVYEELGDRRCVALSLAALGYVARGCGEHAGAAAYYAQSLDHARALDARRDMANALEGLAAALGALERAETAAVLFGGAEALRGMSGAPRSDADAVEYGEAVGGVRAAVGESEYHAAWQRGAALSLEELIDVALSAQPPVDPTSLQTPLARSLSAT